MLINMPSLVFSSLILTLLLAMLSACSSFKSHQSSLMAAMQSELSNNTALFEEKEKMLDIFAEKVRYPLEGLCFYQPDYTIKSSNIKSLDVKEPNEIQYQQVFLLDEMSIAHQMIIKPQEKDFSLVEIRTFPLPPKAEYCAVDDISQQLFVSEENIGIWAYPARAESEVKRSVVDLVKPYGNLVSNSGPLVIIDQNLWVAEKDSHFIHQYHVGDNQFLLSASYQLDAAIRLDGLSLNVAVNSSVSDVQKQPVVVSYLDDNTEQVFQTELTIRHENNMIEKTPASKYVMKNIPADAETQPVKDAGDAADDPAIWLHPSEAEKSLLLGTNKKRGLLVYDLKGNLVQELAVGRVNNVDVRQQFTHKGLPADIAAASQRDNRSIALFYISPITGTITAVNEIITTLDEVYGLCMYRGLENKMYVFINDQDGRYQQYEIKDGLAGWTGQLVREFSLNSQPEGCAADDQHQRLFVGEENVAIWTLGAEPTANVTLEKISGLSNYLHADIEGMDLYQTATENYLLVSSQGNDSYVLFQATAPYEYLGRFRIVLNGIEGIDGASETDGLAVSSAYLGEKYPQGLIIVQDGRNLLPNDSQNFKLVSWKKINHAFSLNVDRASKVAQP